MDKLEQQEQSPRSRTKLRDEVMVHCAVEEEVVVVFVQRQSFQLHL